VNKNTANFWGSENITKSDFSVFWGKSLLFFIFGDVAIATVGLRG